MEFGLNFFPSCGPDDKSAAQYWDEALHLVDHLLDARLHGRNFGVRRALRTIKRRDLGVKIKFHEELSGDETLDVQLCTHTCIDNLLNVENLRLLFFAEHATLLGKLHRARQ